MCVLTDTSGVAVIENHLVNFLHMSTDPLFLRKGGSLEDFLFHFHHYDVIANYFVP